MGMLMASFTWFACAELGSNHGEFDVSLLFEQKSLADVVKAADEAVEVEQRGRVGKRDVIGKVRIEVQELEVHLEKQVAQDVDERRRERVHDIGAEHALDGWRAGSSTQTGIIL